MDNSGNEDKPCKKHTQGSRNESAALGDKSISDLIAMTKKRSRKSDEDNATANTAEKKKKNKNKKNKKSKRDHESDAEIPLSSSTPLSHPDGGSGATDDAPDPFPYLEEDCCETQSVAYENIAPLLDIIASKLHKTRRDLQIYDPYFCEGAMVAEMNAIGFMDVYNKREDFYAKQQANEVPEYDVLVTNPPYSGDHVEKLFAFCIQSQKPYFLLMPNYCYAKDYYGRLFSQANPLTPFQFFVTPPKRLLYTTPKGRRQQKSAKFTSPFPTFWYCYLGKQWAPLTDSVVYSVAKSSSSNSNSGNSGTIARRVHQLPVEVLADADPRKKKERDKLKRSKNKARKKAAGRVC